MPVYRLREGEISFPNPIYARRDGLLAVGGDKCKIGRASCRERV